MIEHAATAPVLHTIWGPAAKLQPDEAVEVVRYVVGNWKEAATR